MSLSSTLPPLTSSSSAPTIPTDLPAPRPAPRRTYGRAKCAESPVAEEPSASTLQPSETNSISLLDRWQKGGSEFLSSMSLLSEARNEGGDEDEDDMEAVKRELERMRREARDKAVKEVDVKHNLQSMPVSPKSLIQNNSLSVSLSNSIIGADFEKQLQRPSCPPSSPPKCASSRAVSSHNESSMDRLSETEISDQGEDGPPYQLTDILDAPGLKEQSFPIRRTDKPKIRQAITSDGEDNDDQTTLRKTRGMPESSQSMSPPLFSPAKERHFEYGKSSLTSFSHPEVSQKLNRDISESDLDDAAVDAQNISAFLHSQEMNEMQNERVDDDTAKPNKKDALAKMGVLFSDEEQDKKKKRKKGLNKKELVIMHRDIQAAERERSFYLSRPQVLKPTMNNWLENLDRIQNRGDVKQKSQGIKSESSPRHFSSDPIGTFTSSPQLQPHRSGKDFASACPSETSRLTIMDTQADQNQDPNSSLLRQITEKDMKEVQHKVLQERKMRFLQIQQGQKIFQPQAAEDDIEILEDPQKFDDLPKIPGKRAGGKLKNITAFQPNRSSTPGSAVVDQELSEVYPIHAFGGIGHINRRNTNTPRQSIQKKDRDRAVTQAELDRSIYAKSRLQSAETIRHKENNFGRGRVLPERQQLNIAALTQTLALNRREDDEAAIEDDEDREDEDLNSDNEVEEDGSLQYEDAEEEINNTVAHESVSVSAVEKDEIDEIDEKKPTFKARKGRRATRVIRSDDEDEMISETHISVRKQDIEDSSSNVFTDIAGQQTDLLMVDGIDEGPELELGGFSDSGNFSQLFDATQAGEGPQVSAEGVDAFALLRNQNLVGLLPTQAMLPNVHISETQVARDDAFVAEILEDQALERTQALDDPKKMYMNTQGLFTQTKPLRVCEPSFSQDFSTPYGKTQAQIQNTSSTHSEMPVAFSIARDVIESPLGEIKEKSRRRRELRRSASRSFSPHAASRSPSPVETLPMKPTYRSSGSRDAFDVMREGALQEAAQVLSKENMNKPKYVQAEAEESDEDMGGWLKEADDEDEESDNEGLDQYIEELVDDEAMDEAEQLRHAELIAEMRKKHEEEDDAKLEAEARKIIQGERRKKRKGRDFYDSDDSDDGRGRRKRLNKKQRKVKEIRFQEGLLPGERNAFGESYLLDHYDTDDDDIGVQEYTPALLGGVESISPTQEYAEEDKLSRREKLERLKEIGRKNRGRNLDDSERMYYHLDLQLDQTFETNKLDMSRGSAITLDDGVDNGEIEYAVTKGPRSYERKDKIVHDEDGLGPVRPHRKSQTSTSLQEYLKSEQNIIRRTGSGAGKGSVVQKLPSSASTPSVDGNVISKKDRNERAMPSRNSTMSSTITMLRSDKFA
ncbi:hypothetical protein L204_100692 [Cryptococcus depauperatus]|nr:hypothetical protein L204_01376 [Cryptococcus depauperatus CBS 7855]